MFETSSAPKSVSATHGAPDAAQVEGLHRKIVQRESRVGVIGLGYVGLPLVWAMAEKGFKILGFDVDAEKVAQLNNGRSYIRHIPDEVIGRLEKQHQFRAVTDFSRLAEVDAVLICVPTPLTRHREPDLSYKSKPQRRSRLISSAAI